MTSAQILCRVFATGFLVIIASDVPAFAQNRLVNMIPQNRSGEQNQDSEPTLAIDPNDYSRMAGSAFTWDNLTQDPMVTNTAPIYVSSDRGATWTLAYIVPSKIGNGFPTGDINLTFGSTLSGASLHETSWLYGGILSAALPGYPMSVLRTQDFLDGATVMTVLDTRTGNVDQPHTRALSAIGGNGTGQDKLYVGFNNGFGCIVPNGRTSTLDVTQSAAAAAPTFGLDVIEARDSACQDGFAQVPAPNLDGTVYAAFIHDWSGSPRVVVVRDDAWGTSGSPFTALKDPSDMAAGRFVSDTITIQSGNMGQQRLGASNLSIAVDPRDGERVYVAYGDSNGPNSETIHVRRSTNSGQDWSPDLLTVTNAMNPEIAINSLGTVGVLYQRVVSSHWETHLTRTTDADGTVFDNPGVLLANTDATKPTNTIASSVYVGDYASLVTAGRNFLGMFSASNYPDTSTFLAGVQFQRFVDWGAHKLYSDAAHTTEVPISIDPYFFEVDALTPDQNFYVRDWTNDASHADNGVEPSTSPAFYVTSDVWNRRSKSPGPFPNDQPTNEDAGNGSGAHGKNWAFARVRRNVNGAPTPVTAHFLVSKFGTGSNYVDSSTGDPDVSFPDPDPVITTDGGMGPWISAPYEWHLKAIAGNHLCLAVEISAPGSPYIPPTLAGQTPGWPTTDLRIINDNHKAQRNMHLSTTPAHPGGGGGGAVTDYAIVHNGALFTRDIPLRIGVSGISKRYLRNASVRTVDQKSRKETAGLGQTLTLRAVQPGENRWIAITVQTAGLPEDTSAYLAADEVVGNVALNGFGVGIKTVPLASAIHDSLELYRGVAERLATGFNGKASAEDLDVMFDLAPDDYVKFIHERLVPHVKNDLTTIRALGRSDPLALSTSLAAVATEGSAPQLVAKVATLLNGVDARLTMLQLEKGDPADIIQMVRWQKQLFQRHPKLSRIGCASKVVAASNEFLHGRETGKLTNSAYPKLLEEVRGCLREALGAQGAQGSLTSSDLATLEKEHRAYLLALSK
jgi:hypothetical protein